MMRGLVQEMNAPHTSAGDVTVAVAGRPCHASWMFCTCPQQSTVLCPTPCPMQHATFRGQTACSLARASTLPCWSWTRPQ